jgi:hypothetical protein
MLRTYSASKRNFVVKVIAVWRTCLLLRTAATLTSNSLTPAKQGNFIRTALQVGLATMLSRPKLPDYRNGRSFFENARQSFSALAETGYVQPISFLAVTKSDISG